MTSLGRVMGWHTSKTTKQCKQCQKMIKPGDAYLNVPKNYRGMAGNYCQDCESENLYWGGHIVEMEDNKKRRSMKKR